MTEENWNRFKQAFIQEQGDYYHYLTTQFPELSETYLRMILLQKIGLKNAEIARLVGITLEGVKKQKQRLRKKYEADFEKIFYCP